MVTVLDVKTVDTAAPVTAVNVNWFGVKLGARVVEVNVPATPPIVTVVTTLVVNEALDVFCARTVSPGL